MTANRSDKSSASEVNVENSLPKNMDFSSVSNFAEPINQSDFSHSLPEVYVVTSYCKLVFCDVWCVLIYLFYKYNSI